MIALSIHGPCSSSSEHYHTVGPVSHNQDRYPASPLLWIECPQSRDAFVMTHSRRSPGAPHVQKAAVASLGAWSLMPSNLGRMQSQCHSQKHASYKFWLAHLHKRPLLPSWVRDLQATFLDLEALIEDDVQVKRPRAPPLPMQIPAQLSLQRSR